MLRAVTDQLVKLQADLVPLIIAETGATATVGSRMQVPVAIERFERYARDAGKNLGIPLPPSAVAATPLAPGALDGRRREPPAGRRGRVHLARTTSRSRTSPARSRPRSRSDAPW